MGSDAVVPLEFLIDSYLKKGTFIALGDKNFLRMPVPVYSIKSRSRSAV